MCMINLKIEEKLSTLFIYIYIDYISVHNQKKRKKFSNPLFFRKQSIIDSIRFYIREMIDTIEFNSIVYKYMCGQIENPKHVLIYSIIIFLSCNINICINHYVIHRCKSVITMIYDIRYY